jgi:two-component system NtrC family sensor kinase
LSQAFNDSFTTKPLGKGSGLGLFLCRTLIEGCGGRIELESTPDAGTTVRVRLPLPQRQRVAA